MSVPKVKVQRTLFDVPVLVGALFAATDRYRVFREKILPALYACREQLAGLYCADNGRPGIEPVELAGVTLLQFMEKAPDRQAAENVRLHLGWKFALELELGDVGFHATSLVNFRARLLEGGQERVAFDALLQALRAEGLIRKRSAQRLDSTHVLGCVAKMSRLECVRETMRLVLETIKRLGAMDKLEGWATWAERYVDSELPWHRLSQEDLQEKFVQAGADALRLIMWLRSQPAVLRDSEQTLVLERVFLEQYEVSAAGPERRAVQSSGNVNNPHDPDAQWAAKDQAKTKTWVGYKAQIAETTNEGCEPKAKGEPTEQFITAVVTTEAIASDLDGMQRVKAKEAVVGQETPVAWHVDAAYVTDDTLAEAKQEDYELIGPARPSRNSSGELLYDADQFEVEVANRQAVCPAGHVSTQCSRLENQESGEVQYRFEWASHCDGCGMQRQCTKSRSGRRMLVVGEHHDLLQQRRREMKTDVFKHRMRFRNSIEGTISEFTRGGGRRTRYRGLAKTALANHFQGAAINARRWISLVQWQQEIREPAG